MEGTNITWLMAPTSRAFYERHDIDESDESRSIHFREWVAGGPDLTVLFSVSLQNDDSGPRARVSTKEWSMLVEGVRVPFENSMRFRGKWEIATIEHGDLEVIKRHLTMFRFLNPRADP